MDHFTPKFLESMNRVSEAYNAWNASENKEGLEHYSTVFVREMKAIGSDERVNNLYRIKNKKGKFIFFVRNKGQIKYHKQKTRRDEILKSRQIGFSTDSCIYAYDKALWEEWSTGIMSEKREKTEKIFEIVKNANDWFKKDWGHLYDPLQSQNSANKILWEESKASITVAYDFRSLTVMFLHVSEAGFIEDERLSNSLQSVPEEGEVILESTSNGAGGLFYDNWQLYKDDPGGAPFRGHFFPWFDNYPENPDNWTGRVLKYTERERELKELYKLEDYHLAWRRWKINESFQGDDAKFEIEYPSDDISCFMSGHNQIFSLSTLKAQESFVKDPMYKGRLESEGGSKVSFYADDKKGMLEVWALPKAGELYGMGVDVAEGIGEDFTVAVVLNKKTGEQVAMLRGYIKPFEMAEEVYKLGKFYNYCWVCPEMNSIGDGMVRDLIEKNYSKLYKREVWDTITKTKTKQIGFRTQGNTKPTVVNSFVKACQDGSFRTRSKVLLNEMTSFVQLATKTGRSMRYEAKPGKKDDCVMAASLAWLMLGSVMDTTDYNVALPENLQYDADTGFLVPIEDYASDY
jgi:hypothetical protein